MNKIIPSIDNIDELRIVIFFIILLFSLLFLFFPFAILIFYPVRADFDTIFEWVKIMSPLWLPLLASFSAFYFANKSPDNIDQKVSKPQIWIAISLLLMYLIGSFSIVFIITVITDYETNDSKESPSLNKLQVFVNWILIISPSTFYAPIYYLTGKNK